MPILCIPPLVASFGILCIFLCEIVDVLYFASLGYSTLDILFYLCSDVAYTKKI